MGLFIGSLEDVKNYFADESLNQSTLKDLEGGLDAFLAAQEKNKKKAESDSPEKIYFIIGGAVDVTLTGPENAFEESYYVSKVDKPTESITKVVDLVYRTLLETGDTLHNGLDVYEEAIIAACEVTEYQKGWKMETKVNKIVKEGSLYFQDLLKGAGKTIIGKETNSIIQNIINSLKTNPRTKGFFDRDFFAYNPHHIDIYYQLPIYFTIKDVKCKALLDIVIVEKNASGDVINVYPIDLKTRFGFTFNFPDSVRKRRYDLQGAWYTDALLASDARSPLPFPFDKVSEKNMKDFQFVVESSTSPGKPLIFELSQDYLNVGRSGYFNVYKGKLDKLGYYNLLDKYLYYSENNWEEEEIVTRFGGKLTLEYEGIREW